MSTVSPYPHCRGCNVSTSFGDAPRPAPDFILRRSRLSTAGSFSAIMEYVIQDFKRRIFHIKGVKDNNKEPQILNGLLEECLDI